MAEKIINIPGLGKVKVMDLGKEAGQLYIVDGITASQICWGVGTLIVKLQ